MRSSMTPKKPSRGPGMTAWSGGSAETLAGPGEMRDVDAARKRVHVRVEAPLGLVEALPARQDEVGADHQLGLPVLQSARSAGERRELVHAVIDDRERAPGDARSASAIGV